MWARDLDDRGEGLADGIVTAEAPVAFDCRNRLQDIGSPLLLIEGERDPFLSSDIAARTAALVPDVTLLVRRRRGHYGSLMSRHLGNEATGFLSG